MLPYWEGLRSSQINLDSTALKGEVSTIKEILMKKNAIVFSKGIKKIPFLLSFLHDFNIYSKNRIKDAHTVIGWGLRPTTNKARNFASKYQLSYTALEDGFLRSIGLSIQNYYAFSLIIDSIGIYYNTAYLSQLEQIIISQHQNIKNEKIYTQTKLAIYFILKNYLSKYNHTINIPNKWFLDKKIPEKKVVLLIDQTVGDMAVKYGQSDYTTFQSMFQAALEENPQAEIWVKTHPDVLCGKKQGYLTNIAQQKNIRLLAEDVNPISLLKVVDRVYCVTSQMGFEALLCGKPVTTFGVPWYAGWGITDDRHPNVEELQKSGRRQPRNLVQLFAAAYLQYSRYINPNTGEKGTIFDVIDYLIQARRLNEMLRGNLYCVGMSPWKRAVIKPFLHTPSCRLHFISSINRLAKLDLPPDARLLAWGRGKEEIIRFAKSRNLSVLRMEDGFIRSVGLGSNLVAPLSLVIDDLGIYFDSTRPSRMEEILQNTVFTVKDQIKAQMLLDTLLAANISKYNVGRQDFFPPPPGKRVLLVPGQVEDDASIQYGTKDISRNIDLLKTVRTRNPDAYIIYKPHPDVESGNRAGRIDPQECLLYADQIAGQTDILCCLGYAHEVHTMTSLSGFEALLRGKVVHCYGMPFYAGWGLTHDEYDLPRRSRRLFLWQLIAGALLYYPTYIHPERKTFIDAQTAVNILQQQKQKQAGNDGFHRSWFTKQAEKFRQLWLSLSR